METTSGRNGAIGESLGSPTTLRFGAVLAALGGFGYFVTLLLHGDLPDQTTAIALEHIADRPEWRLLKLALILSLMGWLGAFLTFKSSLANGLSKLMGQWAVSIATVGVAAVVVEYAIIGHALKDVADGWRSASAPDPAASLTIAQTMLAISGGLFHSFIAWLMGLTFILLGLSIIVGREYSKWLGWIAVLAGSISLTAGTTRFLGIELVPYPLLYGGSVIPLSLWVAVLGFVMWRRSGRIEQPERLEVDPD